MNLSEKAIKVFIYLLLYSGVFAFCAFLLYVYYLLIGLFVLLYFHIFQLDSHSESFRTISIIVAIVIPILSLVFIFSLSFIEYCAKKIKEPKELKESEALIFIYWYPCPDCNGFGTYEEKLDDYQARETVTCNRCNGTGEHPSSQLTLKKSKMFASGLKYLAECPKCEGSGLVLNQKGKKVRCKTCHGKKQVYSAKSDEKIS